MRNMMNIDDLKEEEFSTISRRLDLYQRIQLKLNSFAIII